ncbi:hypothetical protein HAL1_07610 [Halomonas sp. HAL1]|nr:hypothetical protein HAL1_07610 [Halomonas sp. HAL1]
MSTPYVTQHSWSDDAEESRLADPGLLWRLSALPLHNAPRVGAVAKDP